MTFLLPPQRKQQQEINAMCTWCVNKCVCFARDGHTSLFTAEFCKSWQERVGRCVHPHSFRQSETGGPLARLDCRLSCTTVDSRQISPFYDLSSTARTSAWGQFQKKNYQRECAPSCRTVNVSVCCSCICTRCEMFDTVNCARMVRLPQSRCRHQLPRMIDRRQQYSQFDRTLDAVLQVRQG